MEQKAVNRSCTSRRANCLIEETQPQIRKGRKSSANCELLASAFGVKLKAPSGRFKIGSWMESAVRFRCSVLVGWGRSCRAGRERRLR
eukprot:1075960-Pleurochrysis_carterae.AAC.1